MAASGAAMPPGPEVGEIVDGTLPGADGTPLEYRLYRPATEGPAPDRRLLPRRRLGARAAATSDDPLCRDLCVRSNSIIVSVNYRHAPEAPLPGGRRRRPRRGNLDRRPRRGTRRCAGPTRGRRVERRCQRRCGHRASRRSSPAVRRSSGKCCCAPSPMAPPIVRRTATTPTGYVLTMAVMNWFWDHYCDPADRSNPKASPLLADDLSDLPPAWSITCEFDPLRDEGDAYAEAMADAGVASATPAVPRPDPHGDPRRRRDGHLGVRPGGHGRGPAVVLRRQRDVAGLTPGVTLQTSRASR